MGGVGRRTVIRGSLGLAAAGALSRPYIANAAAKTATVWWTQGFIPQEDVAFKQMVANYEKESGNKIDYSIMPFLALSEKMVAAMQTGDTPDLISFDGIATTLALSAWNDKLVDVSDVVETQLPHYCHVALATTNLYNKVEKKRSYYAVPYKQGCQPFHIWSDLVEKAGYKMSDLPDTWDARWNWFKPMQKKLRDKGMRKIYSLGLQMTTNGPSDGNALFYGFLNANGGQNIVLPDGKLNLDPQVREAIIKSITYITDAYKEGYVPPGAISWNDADDNNAFHAKLILMDFDGTLSTELAVISHKKEYDEIVTKGLPLGNDGKPTPAMVGVIGAFVPKAGKNHEVAKDFMKYVIRPKVNNTYLKATLARYVPCFPDIVRTDPFWLHSKDPHRAVYVEEALLGPAIPDGLAYNPAYAEVEAEEIWGQAYASVYKDHMTPKASAEKWMKRIEAIFAKYPIT